MVSEFVICACSTRATGPSGLGMHSEHDDPSEIDSHSNCDVHCAFASSGPRDIHGALHIHAALDIHVDFAIQSEFAIQFECAVDSEAGIHPAMCIH